jgi:glycosyltransferase involved in cell wall biosynthesis
MTNVTETIHRIDPSVRNGGPAGVDVTVVIPCLNEIESVAECVRQAKAGIAKAGYEGEVVVVDNGSTDGSGRAAREAGARVVEEPERGYGSAYRAGFSAARGRYVVMGDADLTYDFGDIPRFLEQLEEGADFVVGSRLRGRMEPGAMPWLHRHLGNPVLTAILNLFFRTGLSDTHCGMRAFRREHLDGLDLRTSGMELASEQIIRAAKLGLEIRELPISYGRRTGRSKLSSFADGWRHLRLLLAHSPKWAFVVPGAALLAIGLAGALVVLADLELAGRDWEFHTLAAAALLTIAGSQVLQIGLFARVFAARYLGEPDPGVARLRLEQGLLLGALLMAGGLITSAVVVGKWLSTGLGPLHYEELSMCGLTLAVLGIQTFFGSLFVSVLELGGAEVRRKPAESGRAPELARSVSVLPEETS